MSKARRIIILGLLPFGFIFVYTCLAIIFIVERIVDLVLACSVSRPPGSSLRAVAVFFYSKKTMQRVFDPMLADMREEYFEALAKGRTWKARWALLSYYWAFAKVLPLHALVALGKQLVDLWKLFGSIR